MFKELLQELEQPRANHVAMDGQIVDKDKPFKLTGCQSVREPAARKNCFSWQAWATAKKFTQLYGISNFDGMQESEVTFSLAMKNEKEIYLMSEKQDDDDKVTYQLQAGKIG